MTRILIAGMIVLTTLGAYGQRESTSRQKIESAKIALITQRLNLSPEQAEKFWPIYNEYTKMQRENRKSFDEAKKNYEPQHASEEDNQQLLQLGMETKEQALQLEKNYSERLLTVINNRQMLSLRKAENDFKVMIMNRIQEQRLRRQQMQDNRQRNIQDMKRRRNN